MLKSRRARGFTLIELMVATVILAIVLGMALPSFLTMMQNSKLGTAAKSYLVGLQTARTEAIRQNLPVQFVMTNTAIAAGIETSAVADAAGKSWVVRATNPASAGSYTLVEAKSVLEGSNQKSSTSVLVSGAATAPPTATFGGVVTFNSLGATSGGETLEFAITNPGGGDCVSAGGPMRCQRIQVRPGGQISMCDPTVAAGDTRACP